MTVYSYNIFVSISGEPRAVGSSALQPPVDVEPNRLPITVGPSPSHDDVETADPSAIDENTVGPSPSRDDAITVGPSAVEEDIVGPSTSRDDVETVGSSAVDDVTDITLQHHSSNDENAHDIVMSHPSVPPSKFYGCSRPSGRPRADSMCVKTVGQRAVRRPLRYDN
jgi:hypothetical protein